jgi:tRNA threonylcarbamoyladenosine biosynthesis protein TsaE
VSPIVSRSAEETEEIGARLGRTLGAGDVVGLCGELGAGKTCFARGVARGLGVVGRTASPTFTLVHEYRGPRPVYHVDAYRVDSLADLRDLGLDEYFDGEGVTLVEWADKMRPLLPARTICVRIDGVGDEPRAITVRRPGGEPSARGDATAERR